MPDSSIAVCSWSLRPRTPAGLAATLGPLSIDAVQLDLTRILEEPDTWHDAPAGLAKAGIRIVSGMMRTRGEDYSTLETIARTGGVRPDETWPANLAHAGKIAALAGDLGLRLVTFHAGFIPEEAGDSERGRLIGRLREIADVFAAAGVDLGFETGQETADTLLAALDELDRPNVGVNFDPANMILYGKGDPVAAPRKLAPRVRQIHIKDALPTDQPGSWGREVPAGQGAVDWPAFFSVARTIDPPVSLVIEREAGEDRAPDIAAARDLIVMHLALNRGPSR